jgi:DNA-binding CsgD family transcriptional regulator
MIDPEPWVNRPHPGPRAHRVPLTREQRRAVEDAIRPAKTEVRVAKRGQAVLLMAAGVGPEDIATLLGVHVRTVYDWKARIAKAADPAAKLADAPRSGRPPSLSRKRTRPG